MYSTRAWREARMSGPLSHERERRERREREPLGSKLQA